jgi:hypothetical protein
MNESLFSNYILYKRLFLLLARLPIVDNFEKTLFYNKLRNFISCIACDK